MYQASQTERRGTAQKGLLRRPQPSQRLRHLKRWRPLLPPPPLLLRVSVPA